MLRREVMPAISAEDLTGPAPLARRRCFWRPIQDYGSALNRRCSRIKACTRQRSLTMRIAFLGLGVMGFPMAGHLRSRGGHDVTVYNRTAAKAEAWSKQHGGQARRSPREAAKGAEIVFMCVGNDDDVRDIVYGEDGALAGMDKGAILVDHTTASAELARELVAKARERGVEFIDAPVSGGQAGAENGQLTVMCGGEETPFARAKPVIDSYAKACLLMGPAGAGQLTKMVNQICIGG